ncbi:hypothetical protein ABIC80_002115 [Kosakonia sp. 1610]
MIILHLFHTVNTNYDSESGTTYSENPAYGWVFAFLQPDSPSNSVRLFAASGSPLRGQRDELVAPNMTSTD